MLLGLSIEQVGDAPMMKPFIMSAIERAASFAEIRVAMIVS